VGVVRNDTTAYIGDADVSARADVEVNALANRDIDAVAIAVAGGAVAAAGSVTVWSIGDAVDGSYSVEQRDEDGNAQGEESANALEATGAAFDGSGGVSGNIITLDNDHSFQTGDEVVYDSGSLDDGEVASALGGLVDGGTVLANAPEPIIAGTGPSFAVDATQIALEEGLGSRSVPIVNTAMVGALAGATGLVGLDSILAAISALVPQKVEANRRAAERAFHAVRGVAVKEVAL